MKKILLVCNHFAPDNTIAAIRTTKLTKYFAKEGFYVKVIAEKKNEQLEDEILKEDAKGIDVVRIENSDKCKVLVKRYKEFIAPYKNKRLARLDDRVRINPKTGHKEFYPYETAYPFLGSLDYIIEVYRQKDLFKQARKRLDNELNYDVMITSYGDRFCIYTGNYIKKKNRDIIWIFDIRDAICRYKFTPKYMIWYAKLTEKIIEKNADKIVVISQGIGKRVSAKYKNKVRVINNGFDKSDRKQLLDRKVKNSKLTFTYTGSMYGGIQDLSPFFMSLGKLIQENVIDKTKVQIDYAGNESAYEIFCMQARKYNVEKLCSYKGKLTRKGSLELQMNSDVLLVASYDYVNGEGGVITGKVLEYMSAEKPIICIINGDIVNSELRQIMEKCRLGCVYEESNKNKDYIYLKKYVEKIYCQFTSGDVIDFSPDKSIVMRYDYKNLSKKYIKLINEKRKK